MQRHVQTELEARLATKHLDHVLVTQLQHDFNHSPFESRAILDVVKEAYLSQLRRPDTLQPGQMVVLAIRADEPPGKPLSACRFVPIVVTVHTQADDHLRRAAGRQAVTRVRRAQLMRMAWEAVAQETYLTVEDLAYRILNCGTRTIEDDLAALRRQGQEVPLRGQQVDIGRGLSHKGQAVRLFLERKTYAEIQRRIHHSHAAIQRYLEDFVAVARMTTAGQTIFEISFLRQISPALVRQYQTLYDTYNTDAERVRLAEVVALFHPPVHVAEGEKGGPTP
ncbi:MAG TPA: DUF1670 domain-containing protein [Herpetosiphonaceae bacterium]|nr:DUF1670 domain-containing protein [Herpetosiphonaceae bacterium]